MGSFLPRLVIFATDAVVSHKTLSIFIFHRVLAERDPLFPSEPVANEFEEMVAWIKDCFNVLPLDEAAERLVGDRLPPRAASITFDDGYADNVTQALPILLRQEVPATFFIATGFLDGGRMWNDTVIEAVRGTTKDFIDLAPLGLVPMKVGTVAEKKDALRRLIPLLKHKDANEREEGVSAVAEICGADALPTDLMMTTRQLRSLRSAGMGVGAHTVSHPILARSSAEAAREEIASSRDQLENLLGEKITLFAYPNGKLETDYTEMHVRMVRDLGFKAAVSTNPGASRHGDNPFELRRFTPWDRTRGRFALRLALNMLRDGRPKQAAV